MVDGVKVGDLTVLAALIPPLIGDMLYVGDWGGEG